MYVFLNIYLFARGERERENTSEVPRGSEGEGEADSLLSREPYEEPDPRILRSRPELKADS